MLSHNFTTNLMFDICCVMFLSCVTLLVVYIKYHTELWTLVRLARPRSVSPPLAAIPCRPPPSDCGSPTISASLEMASFSIDFFMSLCFPLAVPARYALQCCAYVLCTADGVLLLAGCVALCADKNPGSCFLLCAFRLVPP